MFIAGLKTVIVCILKLLEVDALATAGLEVSAYAVRVLVIPDKKSVKMSAFVTLG